jgi:hypothetical protein
MPLLSGGRRGRIRLSGQWPGSRTGPRVDHHPVIGREGVLLLPFMG